MQVFESVQELCSPEQHLCFGEALLLSHCFIHDLLQITAFDEVHDQILTSVHGKVVRNLGEVGMIEAGEDTGFLVKLFDRLPQVQFRPALVEEEGGQDLFDRADAPVQAQIVGLIDRAHAALTDEPNYFISSAQDRI